MGERNKQVLLDAIAYVVLALWCVFTLFPILWMYVSSFKMPDEVFAMPPKWIFVPTLHNYEVLFGVVVPTELEGMAEAALGQVRSQFPRYFMNSVIVTSVSTLLSVSVGAMAAYALVRFRMRGKETIAVGILLTRMIPPVVLLLPTYVVMRNLHLLDTHISLILAYLTFNLPFSIWMLRGFFMAIPPELEEAAMVDGCSRLRAMLVVVLPLAAPGLVATSIFCAIYSWNEFMFAMMFTSENAKTLSPAIAGFVTDKAILWGRLYAAGSVVMLPVIIFSLLIQKYLVKGLTFGAIKG